VILGTRAMRKADLVRTIQEFADRALQPT